MIDLFRDGTEYRRMTAADREEERKAAESAAAENGAEVAVNEHNRDLNGEKGAIKPEFSWKFVFYILKKGFVRYFIDAFTGMAQGLFCTLIAGTILGQIGTWISSAGTDAGVVIGSAVTAVANIAKMLMGAGIGIGIAHALKAPKLVMFTAAVAGLVGAFADAITDGFSGAFLTSSVADVLGGIAPAAPGNPIGAYVVSVLAVELGRLVAGRTKVDIVVVPLVMFVVCLFAVWAAWPFIELVNLIGEGVALATAATPAVMGIVIAVVMGILLTLPTSSAAIWLAVASPVVAAYAAGEVSFATYDAILLAGGASMVGCAAHMVGFAVQSFRENKWGGLIAQGIGTSMLQIRRRHGHFGTGRHFRRDRRIRRGRHAGRGNARARHSHVLFRHSGRGVPRLVRDNAQTRLDKVRRSVARRLTLRTVVAHFRRGCRSDCTLLSGGRAGSGRKPPERLFTAPHTVRPRR